MQPHQHPLLYKKLSNGLMATLTKDPAPHNPRDGDQVTTIASWHPTLPISDRPDLNNPTALLREIHHTIFASTPASKGPAPPTHQDLCNDIQNSYQGIFLKLHIFYTPCITLSTSPFDPKWDRSQIGYLYLTPDTLHQFRITPDRAHQTIHRELRAYEDYLNGRVYTLTILNDGDQIDALPGIYRHNDQPHPYLGLPEPAFLDSWLTLMDPPHISPTEIHSATWTSPPPAHEPVITHHPA